ncbi:MAG TPA: GntR family transcriptional regulator [Calditerricola sp.]
MISIVLSNLSIKEPPLYQKARDVLRHAILEGQLAPGERLTETQLAEQLGISRTPLREALRLLQSEGLVRRDSGGSLYVATVDVGEIESLYQCRIALERLSASLAARRATEAHIRRMRQAMDEAGQSARNGNVTDLLHHNIRFHREIALAGENRWVLRLLEQVWSQMPLFRASVLSIPREQREILAEHATILDRIASKDPAGAAAAMETHLLRDLERGRRMLAQREAGSPSGDHARYSYEPPDVRRGEKQP